MGASTFLTIAQIILGFGVFHALWCLFFSPLRNIPGPFLAKFTDLWRLLSVLGRKPEVIQRELHNKYGPFVRLGPNMVSISDPRMIPEIYSRKTVLDKGEFYKVQDLNVNGQRIESMFSTRNEQLNSEIVRPVTKLYSMGAMIELEPLIDSTIRCFLDHLDTRFAQPEKSCDIDQWLHYCAWDVIGDITFSQRMGFMEYGGDVLNMLTISRAALDYTSVVGMMPWLDLLLERNPVVRMGPPAQAPIAKFCLERIAARRAGTDNHNKSVPDMLDAFMGAQQAVSAEHQDNALLAYVAANVIAGSDTVAAELRAVVYYLCKDLRTKRLLQEELDRAGLSIPVSWNNCQKLPYLCACVNEGFRIFPGAALPLERRIGPSGMVLADGQTVLPPGTLVGINPYVTNRDESVYGADTHEFRPERWLQANNESDKNYQDRINRMKTTDLTFGAGKRVCIGRNLALIECHKIIASLFSAFDVELVDPHKNWITHNAWLMRQTGIDVKLRRRGTWDTQIKVSLR